MVLTGNFAFKIYNWIYLKMVGQNQGRRVRIKYTTN